MGMLLHRHLEGKGVVKATPEPKKVETKLEKEFEKAKEKANDNRGKNSNSKNINK